MGRKATGTVFWQNERWYARITLTDGSRPVIEIPGDIPREDVAKARSAAARLSELARTSSMVKETTGETVAEYSKRWLAYRRDIGLSSVKDDESRIKNHIVPHIGDIQVKEITKQDVKRLVETLDEKVRKGSLSWTTATLVWTCIRTMLRDACRSKRLSLVVRDDDPTANVLGPDRGEKKAKVYLWPNEVERLLANQEVPIGFRQLVAVAIYLYVRTGELRAFQVEDVNLVAGYVNVHRSVNDSNEDDSTKTGTARKVPIEPSLRPLLEHLVRLRKEGRIFVDLPNSHTFAKLLRRYLWDSNVRRSELHTTDTTRRAIRFYDLRATGITWRAIRGDEPLKIMQNAGHTEFDTTTLYIREADSFDVAKMSTFPALPPELYSGSETSCFLSGRKRSRRSTGKPSGVSTTSSDSDDPANGLVTRHEYRPNSAKVASLQEVKVDKSSLSTTLANPEDEKIREILDAARRGDLDAIRRMIG